MKGNAVTEKPQKQSPSEWLDTHKLYRRLIKLGLAVIFLLTLFFSLRACAIHMMDDFPVYAVSQESFRSHGKTKRALFDGSQPVCNVVTDTELTEKIATGCTKYADFTYAKDDIVLRGYWCRFDSEKNAVAYKNSQKEDEKRNRYTLGNYYIDFPRRLKEGENETDKERMYRESYNYGVEYFSQMPIAEFMYRLFVAFDLSTGYVD